MTTPIGNRIYSAVFSRVTVAAVQDLFYIKAGAGNGIELQYVMLTANAVTSPAEIQVRIKRLPATVTAGSAGSSPTVNFNDSADTKAAGSTVRANDTTQATTSGTAAILYICEWNVLNPFEFVPMPETRFVAGINEALIVDVGATPGASTVVSGTIHWAEAP